MPIRNLIVSFVSVVLFSVLADVCFGQLTAPPVRRPGSAYRSTQSQLLGRSTVSPYLSLLQGSGQSGIPRYFTQVRPQLQARQTARQNDAKLSEIEQQVTQVESTVLQNRAQRATGHPTRFMNYSHFYPSLARRRR